jgi:hypothetical protein
MDIRILEGGLERLCKPRKQLLIHWIRSLYLEERALFDTRITDEFTCEWVPQREPLPKSPLV